MMPKGQKGGGKLGYKPKGRVKNGPPKDKRLTQNKLLKK
jgi:hypothetical protein